MGCQACDAAQEQAPNPGGGYYYFRWKNANIQLSGCREHVAEVIEVLREVTAPRPLSVMKVLYEKLGGHYHCRFFTAKTPTAAFGCCGDLVFDEKEWEEVKRIIAGAMFEEVQRRQPK